MMMKNTIKPYLIQFSELSRNEHEKIRSTMHGDKSMAGNMKNLNIHYISQQYDGIRIEN